MPIARVDTSPRLNLTSYCRTDAMQAAPWVRARERRGYLLIKIRFRAALLWPVLVWATLLSSSLASFGATGASAGLPDAPVPQTARLAANPQQAPPPPRKVWVASPWSKWSQYVSPGEEAPVLTRREKANFWLHEEFRPLAVLPALVSGFYGVGMDSDPKYGTNAQAFGKRFGAAVLRETGMRLFVGSVVPLMTGEDPRYYRKATGSIWRRGLYSAGQSFVHRKDDGGRIVNIADLAGHAAACGLTMTYYPSKSVSGRVVGECWATSIGGDVVNNLFMEFWPSVRHRMQMRHERKEMEREQK
jgi:hypothetical protein